VVFGPRVLGEGYPRFWTSIFTSYLLPSMWPVLVDFRSASSRGRRRIAVKPKSADDYVGRLK